MREKTRREAMQEGAAAAAVAAVAGTLPARSSAAAGEAVLAEAFIPPRPLQPIYSVIGCRGWVDMPSPDREDEDEKNIPNRQQEAPEA